MLKIRAFMQGLSGSWSSPNYFRPGLGHNRFEHTWHLSLKDWYENGSQKEQGEDQYVEDGQRNLKLQCKSFLTQLGSLLLFENYFIVPKAGRKYNGEDMALAVEGCGFEAQPYNPFFYLNNQEQVIILSETLVTR